MWYAFQTVIIGFIAYIYLTEVSDQKDVFHAIFLGVIVAFYATEIVSGILRVTLRLIRAIGATLLRRQSGLRGHEKSSDLIKVRDGSSSRTPRLIGKVALRPRGCDQA